MLKGLKLFRSCASEGTLSTPSMRYGDLSVCSVLSVIPDTGILAQDRYSINPFDIVYFSKNHSPVSST